MEKLLKLLNEFEKKGVVHRYERYGQDVLLCRYIKDSFEYYTDEATTIAISKYYGFIEWLVQNNKIDLEKVEKKFYNEICITDYGDKDRAYGKSDLVISVLSISENPIEDLISYLK